MHTSPFAPDRFSPLLHFSDEKKNANIEMILLQTLLLFPIIILISSRGVKSTKYAGYSKVTLAVLSRQVSIMSSSKSFGFINLPFFSARVKFFPNYRSPTLEAERRTKDKSRDWARPSKAFFLWDPPPSAAASNRVNIDLVENWKLVLELHQLLPTTSRSLGNVG